MAAAGMMNRMGLHHGMMTANPFMMAAAGAAGMNNAMAAMQMQQMMGGGGGGMFVPHQFHPGMQPQHVPVRPLFPSAAATAAAVNNSAANNAVS